MRDPWEDMANVKRERDQWRRVEQGFRRQAMFQRLSGVVWLVVALCFGVTLAVGGRPEIVLLVLGAWCAGVWAGLGFRGLLHWVGIQERRDPRPSLFHVLAGGGLLIVALVLVATFERI